jgi:hypothetical protein
MTDYFCKMNHIGMVCATNSRVGEQGKADECGMEAELAGSSDGKMSIIVNYFASFSTSPMLI